MFCVLTKSLVAMALAAALRRLFTDNLFLLRFRFILCSGSLDSSEMFSLPVLERYFLLRSFWYFGSIVPSTRYKLSVSSRLFVNCVVCKISSVLDNDLRLE